MPAGCWGSGEGRNATQPMQRTDEDALTRAIITLASEYGRYGYRRITALLREARLAGGQGSGAAHLAAGGAESAAETAATRAVVAERWFVRAAAAGAGQSRVELRLRERDDARREDAAAAGAASMNTRGSAWRSGWREGWGVTR